MDCKAILDDWQDCSFLSPGLNCKYPFGFNGKEYPKKWYCEYCQEYHSLSVRKHEDDEGNYYCDKWNYLHKEEE